MAIKTFNQIVNDLIRTLANKRPNIDTRPGTFVRDILIDPLASELETFYIALERISNSQSPDLASNLDIEQLGKNFQLTRKPPTRATGTITFYSYIAPISTITIPSGTVMVTKSVGGGAGQQFSTTQQVLLSSTSFNATTGRYEIDAPISAVQSGTIANVAAGAINSLLSAIQGVDGVYNKSAITNGQNFEDLNVFRFQTCQ